MFCSWISPRQFIALPSALASLFLVRLCACIALHTSSKNLGIRFATKLKDICVISQLSFCKRYHLSLLPQLPRPRRARENNLWLDWKKWKRGEREKMNFNSINVGNWKKKNSSDAQRHQLLCFILFCLFTGIMLCQQDARSRGMEQRTVLASGRWSLGFPRVPQHFDKA